MTKEQKQKLIKLRCKAWGITEDEYYCNQCSDFSLEDMARAYRRGKNKGARDKAIQNVGFYQKQMQDIYDKKNKQIAELEKENAELKSQLRDKKCNDKDCPVFIKLVQAQKENAELTKKLGDVQMQKAGEKSDLVWHLKEANEQKAKQLTKAKEIIKELVRVEYADFTNGDYSNELSKVLEQAEQFLNSEVEND